MIKLVFWKNGSRVGSSEWKLDQAPANILTDQIGGLWSFWNTSNGVFNYSHVTEEDLLRGEVVVTFKEYDHA